MSETFEAALSQGEQHTPDGNLLNALRQLVDERIELALMRRDEEHRGALAELRKSIGLVLEGEE